MLFCCALLILLALANAGVAVRYLPEDGGLFVARPGGVVLMSGSGSLADVPLRARLLAIDRRPVATPADVSAVLALHRAGDVLTYRFAAHRENRPLRRLDRGPAERPLAVPVMLSPSPRRTITYVALFALSLLFWLASLLAVLREEPPAGYGPLSLSLFCILAFSFTGRLDLLDSLFYLLDTGGRLLLGPAALLFAHSLGRPSAPARWKRLLLLLGYPATVLILFAAAFAGGVDPSWLVEAADRHILLLAAIMILYATAHLCRRLRESRTRPEIRDRMRWGVLAMVFGASPFALATLLPIAIAPNPEAVSIAAAGFLLVMPLALRQTWSVRNRSFARRRLRSAATAAVSSLATGAGAALLLLLAGPSLNEPGTLVLPLFVAAGVVSLPLSRRGAAAWERHALGSRADLLADLQGFGNSMLRLRDPVSIAEISADRLSAAFDLAAIAITADQHTLAAKGDPPEIGSVPPPTATIAVARVQPGERICLSQAGRTATLRLSVGQTRGGETLDPEEVALLTASCHILFPSIDNALLFRKLEQEKAATERLAGLNSAIVEHAGVGMAMLDAEGCILAANSALLDLLAVERSALLDKPAHQLLPASLFGSLAGEPVRIEIGGRMRTLRAATKPLPGGGSLLTVTDLTLESTIARSFQERDRIYRLGATAAKVAHEVATPLTGVASYAQLLRARLADADLRKMADRIASEAQRAAAIARRILDGARRERNREEAAIDCAELCRNTAELLAPLFEKTPLESAIPTVPVRIRVTGSRDELEEILVNLLMNAREASPDRAAVTVSVAIEPEGAVITVSDRGRGIPQELLPRIFDPFFTTREEGTGLGLYVAKELAEALGGTLALESDAGMGTRASLRFPLAALAPLPFSSDSG